MVDGDQLSSVRVADAIIDESLGPWRKGRDGEGIVEGGAGDEVAFAGRRFECRGGRVARLEKGDVELVVLGLKVVVVGAEGGRAVRVQDDEPVVRHFLRVLVDEAAAHDGCHLRAIERLHFGKDTWLYLVAAVFGEEDWDCRVGEIGHQDVIPGALVCRGATAPGIGVQAEEVDAGRVVGIAPYCTLEVLPSVNKNVTDVSCRVANWDGPSGVLCNIVLEVSGDSPQIWRDHTTAWVIVDNLVSSEETECVRVVFERFHNPEYA